LIALILFIHLAQQLVSIDSRGTSGGMGSNQLKLTSFSRWKYILSIHESENIPIWTIYQLLPFVAKKTPLFHGQGPIFHPGLGYRMISDIGSDILVCVLFCLYIHHDFKAIYAANQGNQSASSSQIQWFQLSFSPSASSHPASCITLQRTATPLISCATFAAASCGTLPWEKNLQNRKKNKQSLRNLSEMADIPVPCLITKW